MQRIVNYFDHWARAITAASRRSRRRTEPASVATAGDPPAGLGLTANRSSGAGSCAARIISISADGFQDGHRRKQAKGCRAYRGLLRKRASGQICHRALFSL